MWSTDQGFQYHVATRGPAWPPGAKMQRQRNRDDTLAINSQATRSNPPLAVPTTEINHLKVATACASHGEPERSLPDRPCDSLTHLDLHALPPLHTMLRRDWSLAALMALHCMSSHFCSQTARKYKPRLLTASITLVSSVWLRMLPEAHQEENKQRFDWHVLGNTKNVVT